MSYVFKSEFLLFVVVAFSSSVCVGQLSGPTRSQLDSYLEKGEFAAANRLAQTAERQKERDSILAEIAEVRNGETPSEQGSEGASSHLVLPRGIEPLFPA